MTEDMGICPCPGCEHRVTPQWASIRDGQYYCCTACAAGHPEGLHCVHDGCPCDDLNRQAPEDVLEEPSDDQF